MVNNVFSRPQAASAREEPKDSACEGPRAGSVAFVPTAHPRDAASAPASLMRNMALYRQAAL
jgi:hypothetical protein